MGSGGAAVTVLLYADDLALLATTAAGLQAQLAVLEAFCQQRALTVNLVKTKVMLLAGHKDSSAAVAAAERGRLSFAGERLPVVSEFRYLGIVFSSSRTLAATAASARCIAARLALHDMRARCSFLQLETAAVQLHLFHSLVDSKLSYGSEVWAPHLVTQAAQRVAVSGSRDGKHSAPSAPEVLHTRFLRNLLGVRQGTPNATVLAETGERPLHVQWLSRLVRFWNSLLRQPPSSLDRQALAASIALAAAAPEASSMPDPWAGWAAQLTSAVRAVGVDFDPAQLQPLSQQQVLDAALNQYLRRVAAAAEDAEAHRKLHHHFVTVRGGGLDARSYTPAAYVPAVPSRVWRQALAQLRTGSHWGAEESGRHSGVARHQRTCQQCAQLGGPGGLEDTAHIVFACPLYAPIRYRYPELVFEGTLQDFFQQPPLPLARFACDCYYTFQSTPLGAP